MEISTLFISRRLLQSTCQGADGSANIYVSCYDTSTETSTTVSTDTVGNRDMTTSSVIFVHHCVESENETRSFSI